MTVSVELKEIVRKHEMLSNYRDAAYINLIQQINSKTSAIIKEDMGTKFLQSCGRDIAGETVRKYFDTTEYNITVDQLALRIFNFSYDNEYDPLSENGGVGDSEISVRINNAFQKIEFEQIVAEMDSFQKKLFTVNRDNDRLDAKGKKNYRDGMKTKNGDLFDELTGHKGSQKIIYKNGKEVLVSDLHADHIQPRESASYNSQYITQEGVNELKEFWNSSDNMQLIHASANTSKGDIRVCEIDGEIKYLNTKETEYKNNPNCDITHRATPRQLTEATVQQWLKGNPDSPKIKKLIDSGYLTKDENGNLVVPKSVKKALERNIKCSQNKESEIVLKKTNYKKVCSKAGEKTIAAFSKIIAGQVIYYTAPPLVYEIKSILRNKNINIDSALEQLGKSTIRIGKYVFSKMKDIFSNVIANSLKKFIKVFMDMLIELVKATVKKMLKVAKQLVLSTVDAVRIIADPNTTVAEKADSVFNLYAVTISTCVIDVIFQFIRNSIKLPPFLETVGFDTLQMLATILCTNLTMLVLQKADLFDVRFGFKINAIKKVFAEERDFYKNKLKVAEDLADSEIKAILKNAKVECINIYNALDELNPMLSEAQPQLNKIGKIFNVYIDYDKNWYEFLESEIFQCRKIY